MTADLYRQLVTESQKAIRGAATAFSNGCEAKAPDGESRSAGRAAPHSPVKTYLTCVLEALTAMRAAKVQASDGGRCAAGSFQPGVCDPATGAQPAPSRASTRAIRGW